ncbi:hypothetical protein ACFYTQ_33085 [Nocardia sp. NPDC004068]|uniref:hypothetical protein n=1 Tax=Nocardia sp. NPDC004068 TaxID=3364303 RepID=UPI0036753809
MLASPAPQRLAKDAMVGHQEGKGASDHASVVVGFGDQIVHIEEHIGDLYLERAQEIARYKTAITEPRQCPWAFDPAETKAPVEAGACGHTCACEREGSRDITFRVELAAQTPRQ